MGEKIRNRRTELGMTQTELAEKVGISRVRLSDIERGVREVIKVSTLVAFSTVLNISIDELLSC